MIRSLRPSRRKTRSEERSGASEKSACGVGAWLTGDCTGGAANTIRPSAEEVARAREENARIEMAARERELEGKGKGRVGAGGEKEARGLADVGKEFLGKGVGR